MDDMGFIGHVITIFGARETYNLPKDYIKYNRNKNVPNTKTITARNPKTLQFSTHQKNMPENERPVHLKKSP